MIIKDYLYKVKVTNSDSKYYGMICEVMFVNYIDKMNEIVPSHYTARITRYNDLRKLGYSDDYLIERHLLRDGFYITLKPDEFVKVEKDFTE